MRARSFVTALFAAAILSAGPAAAQTETSTTGGETGFITSIRKVFDDWGRKVREVAEAEKSAGEEIATHDHGSSDDAEGEEKAN